MSATAETSNARGSATMALFAKNVAGNTILIWSALLFYSVNDFYVGFLSPDVKTLLLALGVIFSVGQIPPLLAAARRGEPSSGHTFFRVFRRFLSDALRPTAGPDGRRLLMSDEERRAVLFIAVKAFFVPVMLQFAQSNFVRMIDGWGDLGRSRLGMATFNRHVWPFMVALIYFVFTVIYSFGYLVQADFLKNKVKSVDSTITGWACALICYPPIIGLTKITPVNYPWPYLNDMVGFGGLVPNFIARVTMLTCLLIMLWSIVVLGFKCSNLTNRGIVTGGPYRVIRHPHYVFKLLHWWITLIPVFVVVPLAPVFMVGWTFVYFLRSVTEERHLRADPDYVAYCQKVRYRFIPGIY